MEIKGPHDLKKMWYGCYPGRETGVGAQVDGPVEYRSQERSAIGKSPVGYRLH